MKCQTTFLLRVNVSYRVGGGSIATHSPSCVVGYMIYYDDDVTAQGR